MQGDPGGFFQRGGGMFFGQWQQALHDAQAWGRVLDASLRPRCRYAGRSAGTIQQVIRAAFDDVPFRAMQMGAIGGELPRFGQRMQGDLPGAGCKAAPAGSPGAPRPGGRRIRAAPSNTPA